MPEINPCLTGLRLAAARTESIAEVTAARPATASAATIGVRVWRVISPVEFTRPAATFVPPTSTPTKYKSVIAIMHFAQEPGYAFALHSLFSLETP
jgi:hypothetical protein